MGDKRRPYTPPVLIQLGMDVITFGNKAFASGENVPFTGYGPS